MGESVWSREGESFSDGPCLKYHLDIFIIFLLVYYTGNFIASSSSSPIPGKKKQKLWRNQFVRAWKTTSDRNGKASHPIFYSSFTEILLQNQCSSECTSQNMQVISSPLIPSISSDFKMDFPAFPKCQCPFTLISL